MRRSLIAALARSFVTPAFRHQASGYRVVPRPSIVPGSFVILVVGR